MEGDSEYFIITIPLFFREMYEFERQREGNRESASVFWLTPHMPTIVGAGPGQTQEPGTLS